MNVHFFRSFEPRRDGAERKTSKTCPVCGRNLPYMAVMPLLCTNLSFFACPVLIQSKFHVWETVFSFQAQFGTVGEGYARLGSDFRLLFLTAECAL
jgi:hypothetical protein